MKKKLLGALLVVCMILAWLPVTSAAATNYSLYVGGVKVTSDNASNITGSGISGSVSFDYSTKTLTLNNATITEVYDNGLDIFGIWSGYATTIHLIGQNTVVGKEHTRDRGSTYAIFCQNPLTFSGSGSLTAKTGNALGSDTNNWSVGIFASGKMTIGENCTITASCGDAETTSAIMSYSSVVIPEDMTVIASKNPSGTPTVTYKESDLRSYKYLKISPTVKYTVTFDANGGSGSLTPTTFPEGNYTLPECGFTAPQGKKFKAWKVNGTEKNAGETITLSQNITITAVWENLPASHTCSPKAVAKVNPTCTAEGKEAYYKCEGCGKFYSDAQGKNVIANISTWGVLNKTDHTPSDWKTNENSHWKECTATACGTVIANTQAAHADGNGDGKCDTCQSAMPTTNTDPSDDTTTDANTDASTDATSDAVSEQNTDSSTDNIQNTEGDADTNQSNATVSDLSTDEGGSEGKSLAWLWILLGVTGGVAIVAAAVIFLLKKKNRK